MEWKVVSFLNSWVKMLTPNIMAVRGEIFGKWLYYESGFMNKIWALIKWTQGSSFTLSMMDGRTQRCFYEQGKHPH
jgi:hypothetical protein